MTSLSETEIRKSVKDRYSSLATGSEENCCSLSELSYEDFPAEASSISDGSGQPLELIKPRDGDTILDLGSGGGADVFQASKPVGQMGHVIGVDATPEMVWRARDTAKKYGYTNVDFRLGEIEHLPVESESVDYVISNCVINLAPDKGIVLKEAFRALKHGGRIAISDTLRKEGRQVEVDAENWCSCETGALTLSESKQLLESSGFQNVRAEPTPKNGHSDSHQDFYLTATKS